MDGCALEVCQKGEEYWFYHDSDGNSMHKVHDPGRRLCRITSEEYWDDAFDNMRIDVIPYVQFICVYQRPFWHVGSFGIKLGNHSAIEGVFTANTGNYVGCFGPGQSLLY